ncbi:crotonase/enoyl-CoA hydratase family protein [Lentibacter algarum]|uniref:crotonase/enoyl-CoA hydratase family protein n=1 Tax=Lentibacter algarum TaxID=576131 RepID=UPI001C074AE2|nr:crotonase/enoyl-CoA hydratase family protein [Lentibacter algarum]MBU2981518.1 crotonase/enoyl-CoA hydratase family protein [Lentibacter algarum]
MSIRIEKSGPDGSETVWTIIHSRPEARNAMDPASAAELHAAFLAFDADESARVAVFWGEGGAFCAGFDLKYAMTMSGPEAMDALDDHSDNSAGPMGPSRLELTKPVIAAIAGPAVAGGMELAAWADMRVMEETAFMGVFCRRWGVPLIDGGTHRLPRLVGEGRAMDLILTGRRVDAAECLAIGLCEYVVPEGQARAKAEQLAHDISRFPQGCMRADMRAAKAQHGRSARAALADEWSGSKAALSEGIQGAARFSSGKGRGGDFSEI